MGAWSESIYGNDTAQDLKQEYQAVFSRNDVETALEKIDAYVRTDFDETDEEEWASYVYSLADFMWKHGILTERVRDRAVEMIDSDFGMDIWAEEGKAVLNRRRKVLTALREKLLSPQPPKKKVRLDIHPKPIFETGDLVAVRLKTLDKQYLPRCQMGEERFRDCEGKFIVLRKVCDHVTHFSSIEPELKDHWAIFQIYARVFDECPKAEKLADAALLPTRSGTTCITQSSLFHFKKRGYRVIGNDRTGLEGVDGECWTYLVWGMNNEYGSPDLDILEAIFTGTSLR